MVRILFDQVPFLVANLQLQLRTQWNRSHPVVESTSTLATLEQPIVYVSWSALFFGVRIGMRVHTRENSDLDKLSRVPFVSRSR